MLLPFPRLIFVFLALALLPVQAAPRRNREVTVPAPPQPVPLQVKATRGQDLEISLRIYGRRNEQLTYLVRKPPRAGRLSEPRVVDQETSSVRYRPPQDRKILRDAFQYAAKSSDGVSAPVSVEIEIVDLPSALEIPGEMTFAARLTGTSEVQTLEIENRGGSPAEGECLVSDPWAIEGSNRYQIEPGARAVIRIRFAPTKGGSFTSEARFTSQIDRVTTLRGSANEPLEIVPSRVVLRPEMTTLVRWGACEVTNHTAETQRVRVVLPERLRSEAEFNLAPGQSHPLVLQTQPGDVPALAAVFSVEAGEYKTAASVAADPLPALVRAIPAEVLFRRENPDSSAIVLENAGGVPAEVRIEPGANLRVTPAALTISPGARERLTLSSDTQTAAWESHVEIRTQAGSQRVTVRAVPALNTPDPSLWPSQIAAAARTSARRSEPASEEPAPSSSRTSMLASDSPLSSFVAIRSLASTSTGCTLEWYNSASAATSFGAEVRELSLDPSNKALVISWLPYSSVRFERGAKTTRAAIEGLKPAQRYTFRILPVENGKAKAPAIAECTFDTLPGKQGKSGSILRWGIVLVALAGVGFLVRKHLVARRAA